MATCKFKPLHPKFEVPFRATDGAACFDLTYWGEKEVTLHPNNPVLNWLRKLVKMEPLSNRGVFPLGFAVEFPERYELQLRPRSGLAAKNGITVLNAPGTIDSDYRAEIGAILVNTGNEPFVVKPGMRVCQGTFAKVEKLDFVKAEELKETDRGSGGFGSTGLSV